MFLQLSGSTIADRPQMISTLKEAISASGGWLMDFRLFSNLSVCLNFEIAAKDAHRLAALLKETKLSLSDASAQQLAEFLSEKAVQFDKDVIATLQVTFIHPEIFRI